MTTSPSARIPRRRRLLYSLLLTVVVLLVGIVTLELTLDPEPAPPFPFENVLHPYVEFRPPSHYTWRSEGPSPSSPQGRPAVACTNEDGLRIPSPEESPPRRKPEGQFRVAVLGGSTVHVGTSFEDSLPGALRTELRRRWPDRDIEVLNAGIISAVSRQELVHLLTTVVDYQPDLVVTYDGINDSGQMLYYERRVNYPYNFHVVERAFEEYRRERRESVLDLALERSRIAQRLFPGRWGHASGTNALDPLDLVRNPVGRRQYAEAWIDNWRRIRKVAEAWGITPLFILQPTSLFEFRVKGTPEEEVPPNLLANLLVYEDFRRALTEFAAELPEGRVLDLSDFLPDTKYYYDGAHVFDDVNPKIAAEIAGLIEPVLASSGD